MPQEHDLLVGPRLLADQVNESHKILRAARPGNRRGDERAVEVIYKVDSRRRTFAEQWRIHWPRVDRFLVAAAHKLLDIPRPCPFGVRRPERLVLYDWDDVPESVSQRLADSIQECEEQGFRFQFFGSIDAMIGARVKAYLAALLHPGGLVWVTVIVAIPGNRHPVRFNCLSRLADGRTLVTSDHVWKLTPLPDDFPEFLPGVSVEDVVERHFERIERDGLFPVRVREDELARILLAREQRHVDYQVQRGVFVPMTAAEIDRLDRIRRE
jgi:hypothetical protein